MRVTKEIRDQVQFACDCCGCPELAKKISIEFNNRFTRRMGDASKKWDHYFIRLSAPLWPRATEAQRRETVIHEACHIIDSYLNGRMCGHKHPWKLLMIKCGLKPERCHSVDRTGIARKHNQVDAYCGCGKRSIGKIKANRIRQGVSNYRCLTCKQTVSLNEVGVR